MKWYEKFGFSPWWNKICWDILAPMTLVKIILLVHWKFSMEERWSSIFFKSINVDIAVLWLFLCGYCTLANTLGKGLKEKRLRTLEAKSKSCWNMHEAVSMPTVRNSHAMTWQETMAEKKPLRVITNKLSLGFAWTWAIALDTSISRPFRWGKVMIGHHVLGVATWIWLKIVNCGSMGILCLGHSQCHGQRSNLDICCW